MSARLIFDIGKTHAKATVFDSEMRCVWHRQRPSPLCEAPPNPQLEAAGLWNWMLDAMREAAHCAHIAGIGVSTHGATAALIDAGAGDGLALPILDYEYDGPATLADYARLRPAFDETLSPELPAGLNLARQLYWQRECFPDAFARTHRILMYPQYWTWRLSGVMVSECTSLGCHTDLWNPRRGDYSSLVGRLGWRTLFPPLCPAWVSPAALTPRVARQTGLPADCAVFAGVHDSNAGFARHLRVADGSPFVLVSTGTWVVCMAAGRSLDALQQGRDMLANVDVNGDPVACARFMGGREYAYICERLGADPAQPVSSDDVREVVAAGVMALPDFSGGSGPFGGRAGRILGHPLHGAALATLYAALMIDYQLAMLDAAGDIVIEGAFLANPLLCQLLAALQDRPVWLVAEQESSSVALGAALLCDWQGAAPELHRRRCPLCVVDGLPDYRERWRALVGDGFEAPPG